MPPPDLERLYDDHAQAVYSFLASLTRSDADGRDLLQDLFVKLARNPRLLRDVRHERSFLLRMAHNAVIDLARRRAARGAHETDTPAEAVILFAPADDPDTQGFRDALTAALGELPPDQRAVVHLKLWEGLTFEEIAGTLSIPLNTAASRYRYGLDKLRARLRPLYDEIA
jgi:RNA polymerase sigma-70 factor, ECF subfamily